MYALVDCNNFYVSCERIFQPRLEGMPVIVLSNNDGCAISRSDEAKALGIQMGAIPHMISPLIKANEVQLFSSNYTLYGDISDRVMKTLASFVPRMEIYSIDEAFLDMHQLPYQDLAELGLRIRRTVKQHTGIPVCVGIAPTKTLAKMANRFAKKYYKPLGVFYAASDELVNEMLDKTSVSDIWGVGRQYALLLMKHGISTAREFMALPDDWIRAHMSVVGLRTANELRGIPVIPWEFTAPLKKGICTGRSFGALTSDKRLIHEAMSNFAANCALKLREQGSVAQEMKLSINTNPHRPQDAQHFQSIVIRFAQATSNTPEILKYVDKGFNLLFRENHKYMKCSVELLDLSPEGQQQLNMFMQEGHHEKRKAAIASLDNINRAIGKDTLRFGIQGFAKSYKARAAHLSPKFTTDFSQLLKVRN
ncbi:MAG: Y-family polymerase [Ferruginibacter sp.]|nr:Y-family polymerase [Ferruginibacter sp.]